MVVRGITTSMIQDSLARKLDLSSAQIGLICVVRIPTGVSLGDSSARKIAWNCCKISEVVNRRFCTLVGHLKNYKTRTWSINRSYVEIKLKSLFIFLSTDMAPVGYNDVVIHTT